MVAAVVLCSLSTACGGGSNPVPPTTPTPTPNNPAPPPPPPPPTPATWSLTGKVIKDDDKSPLKDGRVEVLDGPDAGRTTQTGADGTFKIEGLKEGQLSIRASAQDFESLTKQIALNSDQVVEFALRRVPRPGRALTGSILDGLTGSGISGATLDIAGLGTFTSTMDGTFRIEVPEQEQVREVTIKSSAAVDRQTALRLPGPDARLRLIPSSFDLPAFDQMVRSTGVLQRWVEAPKLTIQTRVLTFTETSAADSFATDGVMTSAETDLLAEDLVWALQQLSASTFSAFASQQRETANANQSVRLTRTGEIVVARFAGLQAATGFWGYSRWATDGAGTVVAGIIMLDRDFETSNSPFRRSLRAHELGHALGYAHVTARPSVMNASAKIEPNEFDLNAVKLAFLRSPGNRTPDRDPDSLTSNLRAPGAVIWATGAR
jgi:predicted Zn-dependent protease